MRLVQILLVAILCPSLQSQQPAPTPTKATQENQRKASPEHRKTETNQQPPGKLPSPLSQDGSVITVGDQQQTGKKSEEKPPTNWWGVLNTALLTLFTGALALLAYRQHQAMRKQARYMRDALAETKKSADAAQRAADTAAAQFEVTERPWISISVNPTRDVTFDSNSINIGCDISFKNIGKSPASNVRFQCGCQVNTDKTSIPEMRESLIQRLHGESAARAKIPFTLFPGSSGRTTASFARGTADLPEPFILALIVCVSYRSTFNDSLHTTATVFFLIHKATRNINGGEVHKKGDIAFWANDLWDTIAN